MSLMNNIKIKNIAIVRLSALGDIVNSAVVLQFIKKFYPEMRITWITEEVFAPILNSIKEIEKVETLNLKKLKKEKSFPLLLLSISKLKALDKFDLVIDMQGLLKSALVSKFLGNKRHGFDKNSTRESLSSILYTTTSSISYENNVIKRNCFVVADALDLKITDSMLLAKKAVFPIIKTFTHESEKKQIAFVIGASWPSKIYPKELVVEVIELIQEDFHIIWGSEGEKHTAEWICQHTSFATLAPKLTLPELTNFISSMDLLIGNDTGPTHIAWAQNIPSITLLGPTTSRMLYETPQNIALKSPSLVNILKINKNDFSIRKITPLEISLQAKALL